MYRTLAILGLFLIAVTAHSQKSLFVRIYDSQGVKIAKGHILAVNDSSIQLKADTPNIISLNHIGSIKTKRSGGHNVVIGTGVGAAAGAILFIATANSGGFIDWSVGEGAIIGTVFGAPFGALLGGLSTLLKRSNTFMINGSPENFKAFQAVYNSLSAN